MMSSSSRGAHSSRWNSRRERRSQSCLELQGKQIVLASISTLSLPPTVFHCRPQSQSSRSTPSPVAHTHSTQSLCSNRPTKSSRLRAHSAPVKYAEPDYKQIARRKKESALREKTVTAEKILRCKIPEDQSLHSFLTGGRYNSTHHMDARSLQRFGVYVPRNSNAEMFINPAGTVPPSAAVYGMHPLKKHRSLIVPNPPTRTFPTSSSAGSCYPAAVHTGRLLPFLAERGLDSQYKRDDTPESYSLTSQQGSVDVDSCSQSGNISTEEDEKSEPKENLNGNTAQCGHKWRMGQGVEENAPQAPDIKEEAEVEKNVCHPVREKGRDHPIDVETGEEEVVGGDDGEGSDSAAVSDSDLLSPEAQLLTHEILLETESLCSTKSVSSRICKQPVAKSHVKEDNKSQKAPPRNKPDSSKPELVEQPYRYQLQFRHELQQTSIEKQKPPGKLVETLAGTLRGDRHNPSDEVDVLQQCSTARPKSASIERHGIEQRSQTSNTSKRPKSAVHAQNKQAAIFVDLSKLHSLHVENATCNAKDSL